MGRPSGGAFVGLDIGTHTIKVVEVRGAGKSLQITGVGFENTPPGVIQQGVITDAKLLGTTIKKLLSKSGIGAKRSVSSVAGANAVVRVIEVPRMTPTELAETMKWEVERHIPFAANDVEMDYQPIADTPTATADGTENPNMEVLLAVAQRDLVAQHLEVLQAAGLNPVAIDVEPLAVGRALVNLSPNDLMARNVVTVNIGASNTDVAIFKSGVLRFPRDFPLGGDNFSRAISDSMGLTMEQAEDEKRENAMIFMDLISAPTGPEFGGEFGETAGSGYGGGFGSTPFDIPMDTPFAERAPDATPPPMGAAAASPFDMGDQPAADAAATTPPAASDNPFASAPIPDASASSAGYSDNPFATPPTQTGGGGDFGGTGVPGGGAVAPVPDDPQMRRRREVFDALLPVLGEFSMELRRSVDYFRSRYPEETIDQIILCGGSARIRNLDQYIQNDLGIPTIVGNPFGAARITSKHMSADYRDEIAPAFAVAVGLAARDAVLGSGK